MGNSKLEVARFRFESGPKELFDRVLYKMKDQHMLLYSEHFQKRAVDRKIPMEVIRKVEKFDCEDWSLIMAEVRVDKYKFVNSTWEMLYENNRYWITIGFGNNVQTIVRKTSSGLEEIFQSGEIYDNVKQVNRELMLDDYPEYSV